MEAAAARWLLAGLLVPMWIGAGVLDWWCHRRTDIEHNAGAKESLLHLLMFVEVGLPLLAVLFLDINALIFLIMGVAFVLHEATALWDVSYAVKHRTVTPFEQHVHSFLELLPLTGLLLLAVLHPQQALALLGLGSEPARFELVPKDPQLPPAYLAGVLSAVALLGVLPYMSELVRGLRARARSPMGAKPTEDSARPTAAAR